MNVANVCSRICPYLYVASLQMTFLNQLMHSLLSASIGFKAIYKSLFSKARHHWSSSVPGK